MATVGGKSFCLDAAARGGLTTFDMPFSTSSTPIESLAEYPPWFVAACVTVVGVTLVWVAAKLLKWSLYVLMVLMLLGGVGFTLWLFFN